MTNLSCILWQRFVRNCNYADWQIRNICLQVMYEEIHYVCGMDILYEVYIYIVYIVLCLDLTTRRSDLGSQELKCCKLMFISALGTSRTDEYCKHYLKCVN